MSAVGLTVTLGIAAGAAGAAAALAARAVFSPRSGIFGPVTFRGSRAAPPRVALTFDDGPDPDATPRILDVLERMEAPAAFFVIGQYAGRHPALLRRMHEAGHELGNHSFHHARFGAFRRRRYWIEEIARTQRAVADAADWTPRLFRPPMGLKNPHVVRAARAQGLTVVTWTRRAFDGVPTTATRILARLEGRTRAGDIVALHDGIDPNGARRPAATVEALGPLIERLRRRGLEIVPLAALIEASPVRPQPET